MKNLAKNFPNDFFAQDTIDLAQSLLGHNLVHNLDGEKLVGRIIETEAYLGLEDPACHSFHGKVTKRTKTFYMPAGTIYVYLIYGMYECFNLITGDRNTPEAVLIRALWPLEGLEKMRSMRPKAKSKADFCNGPGKLCQAMGIDRSFNEQNIFASNLSLEWNQPASTIIERARVGIESAGDASHWPLRFIFPLEFL